LTLVSLITALVAILVPLLYAFFTIDGRRFSAKSKRGCSEPTSLLFVGSLPSTATESGLKKIFSGCDQARIMFDENDKSRG